jgi:hypothetical protein
MDKKNIAIAVLGIFVGGLTMQMIGGTVKPTTAAQLRAQDAQERARDAKENAAYLKGEAKRLQDDADYLKKEAKRLRTEADQVAANDLIKSETNEAVILSFNAIGPYVNEQAGYVCEGERWWHPTEDSIVWQGENDEYVEFFYHYDGVKMSLTNKATGKKTSFQMQRLSGGKWMVNGKVLQECAG